MIKTEEEQNIELLRKIKEYAAVHMKFDEKANNFYPHEEKSNTRPQTCLLLPSPQEYLLDHIHLRYNNTAMVYHPNQSFFLSMVCPFQILDKISN